MLWLESRFEQMAERQEGCSEKSRLCNKRLLAYGVARLGCGGAMTSTTEICTMSIQATILKRF